MEIEEEYNKRHQQFISERINNQRNLNLFSISDKILSGSKEITIIEMKKYTFVVLKTQ